MAMAGIVLVTRYGMLEGVIYGLALAMSARSQMFAHIPTPV
jgi:hypothetical protein